MASATDPQSSRLRVIALFEDLPDQELAAITRACITRSYKKGAEISAENEHDVFFILDGTVRANSVSGDGREIIYTDLAAGAVVGEFAAIDGAPRASAMVATSDCLLARMPGDRFVALLKTNSTVSTRMIQLLVGKIRRMSERVFEVSALAVRERVRRELVRLAAGGVREGKSVVLRPAPTHYELAARIGSHREAVTRELNRLEEEKVLEIGRREIRIVDLRVLREAVRRSVALRQGERLMWFTTICLSRTLSDKRRRRFRRTALNGCRRKGSKRVWLGAHSMQVQSRYF